MDPLQMTVEARLTEAERLYAELLKRAHGAQRPVSAAVIPACLAALGDLETRIVEIRGLLKPTRGGAQ